MKNPVVRVRLPDSGRIAVVSDIHGNVRYFEGLMKKLALGPGELLVIDGDFLEKGPESLRMLRMVMELYRGGRALVVRGNCDGWHELLDRGGSMDDYVLSYMRTRPNCLLRQMCSEQGFDPFAAGAARFKDMLCRCYGAEMEFLRGLPAIIETRHYTFVHGGISAPSAAEADPYRCMKNDDFLGQGLSFDKWMIVGHWPVSLYREDYPSAAPIILRDRKIASIDGGCVLKRDGQLNALVIPRDGSEDFQCVHYDHFPVLRALDAQAASDSSYHVRWGDDLVDVLRRGREFSLCRHVRTGRELEILNKYLPGTSGRVHAADCTDYRLPVTPGDELAVVEATSRGFLCKKNGTTGWYRGRLAADWGCVSGQM